MSSSHEEIMSHYQTPKPETRVYEIWVQVPDVLCHVEANDESEARKKALEVAPENIDLKHWPDDGDILSVTEVSEAT